MDTNSIDERAKSQAQALMMAFADEQPKNNEHYRQGSVEVIDIIKLALTDEQYEGYLLGNMLKYILRADFKGQHNSDMTKSIDYAMMKMCVDTELRDSILNIIKEEVQ